MSKNTPLNPSEIPLYKKAVEILILSQNISSYLTHDLCALKNDGSEDGNIYFSGDIVQQSVSLVPEILNAELAPSLEHKHRHITALKYLINKLYRSTHRLEKVTSNGADFLPVLRRELGLFKKMHHSWMLTL